MKKLAKTFAVISAVILLLALLIGALVRIFTDKEWVLKEYERIDIEAQSGYTPETAAYVLGAMMDYSIGKAVSLDKIAIRESGESVLFFNESELSHMVDVQKLATSVLRLGLAGMILGAGLFLVCAFLMRNEGLRFFARAFLTALGALLVIIAALGIWMAIDFDSFWSAFHVVFLDLESSTFDPAVSRMICICPPELFSDMIMRLALIAGLCALIPIAMCLLFLLSKKAAPMTGLRLAGFAVTSCGLACFIARLLTGLDSFLIVGNVLLLAGAILLIVHSFREKSAGASPKSKPDGPKGS